MCILVLLLLSSFVTTSFESCTKFNIKVPTPFDLMKVTTELTNLGDLPKLTDLSNILQSEMMVLENVLDYQRGKSNEDAHLTIKELVNKYGFNLEEHEVTTEDGYILTLHRIKGKGRAVFLMHGVLGSSADFVLAQKDSLPYLLAGKGYDVWMGNARGNKYSRKHETISPTCGEFWDFSWDEIGYYDLPAFIDYVLKETGQESLCYIGYSQGTTSFFVMASSRPDFNEKIASMVALSPIAFLEHVKSPIIKLLAANVEVEGIVLDALGVYEVFPSDVLTKTLSGVLCGNNPFSEIFCSNLVFMLAGFDVGNLDISYLYTIFQHFPAGASTKQLKHYAQSVNSKQFRKYNYDSVAENFKKYGLDTPPKYNISSINGKLTLFRSDKDWLGDPKDVDRLVIELSNAEVKVIDLDNYNHVDWLYGRNVKTDVYDLIVDLFENEV